MRRLMRKSQTLAAGFVLAAAAAGLAAQTPSPTPTPTPTATTSPTVTPTPTVTPATYVTPTGQNWTTDGNTAVNGARVAYAEDGSTWFLTASNDRVARLKDGAMTQWQVRPNDQIGANPVDLQIDGDFVWFIDNGQSQIDAGKSIVSRLDTTTGALREWVLPTSRPAGFYRSPDGKMLWVAQSAGFLESLNLETLEVVDYRAGPVAVFASIMVPGPDGALWTADFGNNRIVRHDLADNSEKSWTLFDPAQFRLNPTDMKFDEQGNLWITELSAGRVDRLTPSTGELRSYPGFASVVHLDIFGGNLYLSHRTGANGRMSILDPRVAPYVTQTLTPVDLAMFPLTRPAAEKRDSVLTPIPFAPTNAAFAAADLTVAGATPGILAIEFNKTNAHGIAVAGGAVWVGSNGFLIRLVPQTLGGPTDQTIPLALQAGAAPADPIHVDLTLFNRGTEAISGVALYQYSAAAFPKSRPFTLAPGETALFEDAFLGAATSAGLVLGPVRLQVTSGSAADLVASARSARSLDNSGSFGLSAPAQSAAETMQAGSVRTLFTGARSGEISTFGYFSSTGAQASVQLIAPDGTVRGSRTFSIESNASVEHNPAAKFFGVAPQAGDVLRVAVTSGTLQPYVTVQDPISRDVAVSLPLAPTTDAVIPSVAGVGGASVYWSSALQLSNPDASDPATVTATYYPLGSAAGPTRTVTLPPNGSIAYADVIADLFGAPPGQGAVVLTSTLPVAASQRVSAQDLATGGQYASQSAALDGASPVPSGGAQFAGVRNSSTRRTHLLLFNRGAAGTLTIDAFDASGAAAGQLLVPMGPQEAARVNKVLEAAGAAGISLGRIRLTPSSGMQLYAQTVDVDAVTADTELQSPR
jgi:streptogramin lyase